MTETVKTVQQLRAENRALRERVAELEQWQAESRLVEKALMQAHEQLNATLNALPDLLFIVDRHGVIYDYRAPQPELLYLPPEQFLNKPIIDVLPPDAVEIIMQSIETSLANGRFTGAEYSLPTPAGESWFELSIASQGDVTKDDGRLIVLVRDITQRKQATLEREALIKELNARNLELGQFAYTVSHDLKSPIITIQGFLSFVDTALQAGDLDRAAADLQRIHNAADKMVTLLDDLLELSRVGSVIKSPEPVSLNRLVEETINLVAGRLFQRGVQLRIMPRMPPVMADPDRLRQVLQNLLENGIKFMGDQPEPAIEIGARDEDGMVTCYVRDNGVGIPPRYCEQIFDIFEKLDQDGEGSGIGLTLVKRIVEGHGGRAWVESQGKGHGSTFYFSLPATQDKQPA